MADKIEMKLCKTRRIILVSSKRRVEIQQKGGGQCNANVPRPNRGVNVSPGVRLNRITGAKSRMIESRQSIHGYLLAHEMRLGGHAYS